MRARPDTVHGTRLQIDKDGTRHILALVTFIVVDVDALQLELHQVLISTSVFTSGLDAMLVTDDFPELEEKRSWSSIVWLGLFVGPSHDTTGQ